ncbi:hypothetical protein [Methanothermobacter sp.]
MKRTLLKGGYPQGEFRDIIFSGTMIAEGRALGAVIPTGRGKSLAG